LNQSGIETFHWYQDALNHLLQFELNQSGIETQYSLGLSHTTGYSLNWTKVELRQRPILVDLKLRECLFELNQSGIETDYPLYVAAGKLSLNWTKVELRLPFSDSLSILQHLVWIEPKWNWDVIVRVPYFEIYYMFELNQSGIETNQSVLLRTYFTSVCLNWTKVELRLKISVFKLDFFIFLFELNQSGIETKYPSQYQLPSTPEFELNQSGIETWRGSKRKTGLGIQFELNQSGIETDSRRLLAFRLFRRLNWTKVELRQGFIDETRLGQDVWIEPKWNWDFHQ